MYEKVTDRSEGNVMNGHIYGQSTEHCTVLDDRIDEFAEIIREYYNISDMGDPGSSTEVYHSSLFTFSSNHSFIIRTKLRLLVE